MTSLALRKEAFRGPGTLAATLPSYLCGNFSRDLVHSGILITEVSVLAALDEAIVFSVCHRPSLSGFQPQIRVRTFK